MNRPAFRLDRRERKLLGVCAGLGRTLNIDPTFVRVAFVAGEGFFIEGGGKGSDCMRISFGGVPEDRIRTGAERLGRLICSKLKTGMECRAE